MANLTITIEDDVLKRARLRALERGSSVNAILADYLRAFAGLQDWQSAANEIVELAETTNAGSGHAGRRWEREDIYER